MHACRNPQSELNDPSPRHPVFPSLGHPVPHLRIFASLYPFLPPVPRHLPDEALCSELAIELRIDAFATMIDIQALATLLTESGFMLVTDPNGLPVRMISAHHRLFAPAPLVSRFETGRGLSST